MLGFISTKTLSYVAGFVGIVFIFTPLFIQAEYGFSFPLGTEKTKFLPTSVSVVQKHEATEWSFVNNALAQNVAKDAGEAEFTAVNSAVLQSVADDSSNTSPSLPAESEPEPEPASESEPEPESNSAPLEDIEPELPAEPDSLPPTSDELSEEPEPTPESSPEPDPEIESEPEPEVTANGGTPQDAVAEQEEPEPEPASELEPEQEEPLSFFKSFFKIARAQEPSQVLLPADQLVFSNFATGEEWMYEDADLARVVLSLSGQKLSGALLKIEYSTDGESWVKSGDISFDSARSNGENNNFFSFKLPTEAFSDPSALQIRLSYEFPAAAGDLLKIDAIWVETGHSVGVGEIVEALITDEEAGSIVFESEKAKLALPEKLGESFRIGEPTAHRKELTMSLRGANAESSAEQSDRSVIYREAFASTDLKYEVSEAGLKEYIVLKDKSHPKSFVYEMNIGDFDALRVSDTEIELYKKGHEGEPLYRQYTLSAPYMEDARGERSQAITLSANSDTLTITPSSSWLASAEYPVVVDPTVAISVLNVHSHPVQGELWTVDFTTEGSGDLYIRPADQETIDDMEFQTLTCEGEDVTGGAEVLEGDVVFFANWECAGIASVAHLDLKTGDHHLVFEFSGEEETAVSEAFNATFIWDGGGSTNNWSECANWSGDACPTSTDLAVFDTTSTKDATIDSSFQGTLGGLTIMSGYTGTITQARSLNINGTYSQADGTFTGGSDDIQIRSSSGPNGDFLLTGGTFTSTTGNLNINNDFNVGASGTFDGNGGTLTIFAYGIFNPTLFTCDGTIDFDLVVINKTGSSNSSQTTIGSGCVVPLGDSPTSLGTWPAITNNGTIVVGTGTWTISGGYQQNSGAVLTMTGDTIDINSVGAGDLVLAGGTWPASVTNISLEGDLDNSNNLLNASTSLTLDGPSDFSLTCGTVEFSSVTINKGFVGSEGTIGADCTLPLGDNPTVKGTLINNGVITAGTGTMTFNGSLINNSTTSTSLSLIDFNSGSFTNNAGGVLTMSTPAINIEKDLTINGGTVPSGIVLTLDSTNVASVLTCGSATFSSVTIDKSSVSTSVTVGADCTLPLGDNATVDASITNNGTITAGTGTLTFSSNYTQNSGSALTMTGTTLNVHGNLTLNGGTFSPSITTINLDRNLDNSGNIINDDTTLNLIGGHGESSTLTCGTADFSLVTINKTGATGVIVGEGCTIPLGDNPTSVTSRIINNGTINVGAGTWTITNPYPLWDGDEGFNQGATGNLDISGTAIVINNGNMNVAAGSVTAPSLTSLSVEGNFDNSGNLLPDGLTLTLIGTGGSTLTCGDITFDQVSFSKDFASVGDLSITIGADCTIPLGDNPTTSAVIINNNGIVNVGTGTWTMNNADALPGNMQGFYLNNGAELNFDGTTLDLNSQGLFLSDGGIINAPNLTTMTIAGTIDLAGSIFPDSVDVTMDGGNTFAIELNCAGTTFNSLTINRSSSQTITPVSDCSIAEDFTRTNGNLVNPASVYSFTIGGDFSMSTADTMGGANLTLEMAGDTDTTITQNAGTLSSPLIINKGADASVTQTTNLVLGSTLDITSGALNQGASFSLTTGGAMTIAADGAWLNIGTGDVTLGGDVANAGEVLLDGSGLSCGETDAITIASSDGTARTWSGAGTFSIADVSASDMSGSITAYNSTDDGDNTWTFSDDCNTISQADYGWFENADSLTPGSALESENTPLVVADPSEPVRLRFNLNLDGYPAFALAEKWRLQYSDDARASWVGVGSSDTEAEWFNLDWGYRKRITFDNSASAENLVNFPVLITLDSSNIDYSKTQDDGADLRFTEPDGTTLLDYEIESWDEAGESFVWVRVPELEAASTTQSIWMYYGNSEASDAQDAEGVWDSDYRGVWHMDETPANGGTQSDSTSNGIDITLADSDGDSDTDVAGQINGADDFNGDADMYNITDATHPTAYTMSMWVKPDDVTSVNLLVRTSGTSGPAGGSYSHQVRMDGSGRFQGYLFDGGFSTVTGTTVAQAGEWYWVAVTAENSDFMHLFVNGEEEGTADAITTMWTGGSRYVLAGSGGSGGFFSGVMDEVRLSLVARSADWIEAEYLSMTGGLIGSFGTELGYDDLDAPISFFDNPSVASGTTLPSLLLANSTVAATYEEGNLTSLNPNDVLDGGFLELDFSLDISNITAGVEYFFRLIFGDDNSELASYDNYPSLTYDDTPPPPSEEEEDDEGGEESSGGGGGGGGGSSSQPPESSATSTLPAEPDPSEAVCPDASFDVFTACFYDNRDFTNLVATSTVKNLRYNWRSDSPAPNISSDTFSATWEGWFDFDAEVYEFIATADDGIRVYVDGILVVDEWYDQSATEHRGTRQLTKGLHLVRVEYYENSGQAVAEVVWHKRPQYTLDCPTAGNGVFTACYFDGMNLKNPIYQATTSAINYNWGTGSPGADIPENRFSAMWHGYFEFEGGDYIFQTKADDGVRVFVDGVAVINQWRDQSATEYWAEVNIPAGRHLVRMEYYENGGQAFAFLNWEKALLSTSSCPEPAKEAFSECIYNNRDFTQLSHVATVQQINYDWRNTSPAPAVSPDTFSATWAGDFTFVGGKYEFSARADDGVRVYIDGERIIDDWSDHSARTRTASREIEPGVHRVLVEYYENGGQAAISLSWELTEPLAVIEEQEAEELAEAEMEATTTSSLTEAIVENVVESVEEVFETAITASIETVSESVDFVYRVATAGANAVSSSIARIFRSEEESGTLSQNYAETEVGQGALIADNAARKVAQRVVETLDLTTEGVEKIALSTTVLIPPTASVVSATGGSLAVTDLGLRVWQLWLSLLSFAGLRKARRYWGVVYDSATKLPLELAFVRLVDVRTGKVVDSTLTDFAGRYGFLPHVGIFKIEAGRKYFNFPSSIVQGNKDGIYDSVYHGEHFELRSEASLIAPNIPLDAFYKDQSILDKYAIVRPRRQLWLKRLFSFIYWAGFAFVVINTLASFTPLSVILLVVYATIAGVRYFRPKERAWGILEIGNLKNIHENLRIELYGPAGEKISESLVGPAGQFFLPVKQEGTYELVVQSLHGEVRTELKRLSVVADKNLLINHTIRVK